MSDDLLTHNSFKERLSQAWAAETERLGLLLSEQQMGQLIDYGDFLIEQNRVMNLTAIVEPEEVAKLHFADSLMLLPELAEEGLLVDVGTGAGLPGIPLKIMRPDLKLFLVDALAKRIRFLEETVARLGLKGVTCIHARAEDVGRDKQLRGQADVVTARAVAALPVLAEYCQPLLKIGGRFLAMKGRLNEAEFRAGRRAVHKLGGEIRECRSYVLPGSDIARSLVVIEQQKKLPGRYPRKAGIPAKHPL